jgi:hypothetical protein
LCNELTSKATAGIKVGNGSGSAQSVGSYRIVIPHVISFEHSVVDEGVAKVGVHTRVATSPGRQPTRALKFILRGHNTKGLRICMVGTPSRRPRYALKAPADVEVDEIREASAMDSRVDACE